MFVSSALAKRCHSSGSPDRRTLGPAASVKTLAAVVLLEERAMRLREQAIQQFDSRGLAWGQQKVIGASEAQTGGRSVAVEDIETLDVVDAIEEALVCI